MPFYEYRCQDCRANFELFRGISQRDEIAICPDCAGNHSSRMVSVPVMFSHSTDGAVRAIAGAPSGCGSCSATSCGTCSSN
ncbi:MAG: zinc ribbon domain-containing protein [Anaerolineae bacterium]|nr:zinc ribbon domain-containing protein [Anaerolineae bacterium]MBL6966272.1 zinc ribbon domain-containing protein [Anaerolineales bacterium]